MSLVRLLACLVVVGACLALVACNDTAESPTPAPVGVTREVFGTTKPASAPGQELTLSQVTIEPGAGLGPHTHPGTQMARISGGTLTYAVYHGEVTVTRKGGQVETHGADDTVALNAGDSLLEPKGMVHSAKNDGSELVVILLTSLFEAGEPASRPADVE